MNRDKKFSVTAIIYSSKESIWTVLLSGQLYQTTWGAELQTTWEAGSSVQFQGVWEGVAYADKGVVQVNQENSFLKYSYWSSFWNAADVPEAYCFISYRIHPLGDQHCELTISQEGFRDEKHYNDTVALWNNMMAVIKSESEKVELASMGNRVFNKLISIVDSVPEDIYNQPAANRWSIAQIVEHIISGNSGMKKFLTESPLDSTAPYDVNIQRIRDMMLNRKEKMRSPDFLIPPLRKYDKAQHREVLLTMQKEIDDCVHTLDMSKICGSFELPSFGYMSTFEWLNFSVFHIFRHTLQMEAYWQEVQVGKE